MKHTELVKPMLCKPGDVTKISDRVLNSVAAELKLDGMRAIVYNMDNELRVFGRSGLQYTRH